jgi:thiol-disulfide isomerase/thioredoxin
MLLNFSLRAPEFPNGAQWLNSKDSLLLSGLKGHVVVLDFWTYCCINCIHILPDLKWLEEKYRDQPVMVIGVHAAKFLNEQDSSNIESAIARYQIEHPVVVDNDHRIWDSYAVRAWPTFVVIDTKGYIQAHFSGEGHREDLDVVVHKLIVEGRKNKTLAKESLRVEKPISKNTSALAFPGKICFHPTKNELFIADSNHHRILHCQLDTVDSAKVLHVIGSGNEGKVDGSFSVASLNKPQGLWCDGDQLFICDTDNHLIRKANLHNQTIETVAGTGEQSHWGEIGGLARSTSLSSPWDITPDPSNPGDHLIAMAGSHQIWKYSPESGSIIAVVGSGQENLVDGPFHSAQLAQPSGICGSITSKSVFFADSEVSAIRQLNLEKKKVQTLVGHGLFTFGLKDGLFEDALLQHPLGLCVDENEGEGKNVFVADTYNHAIRLLDLSKQVVTTLIKRESHDVCSIDDKSCNMLPLSEPNDVKKRGQCLYIADTNNHLIRVFDVEKKTLTDLQIAGL